MGGEAFNIVKKAAKNSSYVLCKSPAMNCTLFIWISNQRRPEWDLWSRLSPGDRNRYDIPTRNLNHVFCSEFAKLV